MSLLSYIEGTMTGAQAITPLFLGGVVIIILWAKFENMIYERNNKKDKPPDDDEDNLDDWNGPTGLQ